MLTADYISLAFVVARYSVRIYFTTTSHKCSIQFMSSERDSDVIFWNSPECLSNQYLATWARCHGAVDDWKISSLFGGVGKHDANN